MLSCCGNYICRKCLYDIINKSKSIEDSPILCPSCRNVITCVNDVDPNKSIRFYSDDAQIKYSWYINKKRKGKSVNSNGKGRRPQESSATFNGIKLYPINNQLKNDDNSKNIEVNSINSNLSNGSRSRQSKLNSLNYEFSQPRVEFIEPKFVVQDSSISSRSLKRSAIYMKHRDSINEEPDSESDSESENMDDTVELPQDFVIRLSKKS